MAQGDAPGSRDLGRLNTMWPSATGNKKGPELFKAPRLDQSPRIEHRAQPPHPASRP